MRRLRRGRVGGPQRPQRGREVAEVAEMTEVMPGLPDHPRKAAPWPTDGWLGTPELPGYRAGNVVVRLSDLPAVDAEHLYFNLLLLDAQGDLQDLHSGPCPAMGRHPSNDERSRFVRVVAELVRHAPSEDRGLTAITPALNFLRERGIEGDRLLLAAQLLDDACTEAAVARNLAHLLTLSLGADEARDEIDTLLAQLPEAPAAPRARQAAEDTDPADGPASGPVPPGPAGLQAQTTRLVRRLGKTRARRYLRSRIDLALVPAPDLLGV